jgi:hypothetical protein
MPAAMPTRKGPESWNFIRPEVKAAERARVIGGGPGRPLVGLSFSGGGIRSATFNLGILQALRSLGIFDKVDYLSTVSGGGYIGGWLQGILARGRAGGGPGARALDAVLPSRLQAPQPEAREIRFLRQYSNYLTPKLGLFSGDTWAAVGNTLRNLLLNFTVLSLALMVPLFLPWLAALTFWQLAPSGPATMGALVWAALFLATAVMVTALNMKRPLASGGWSPQAPFEASTPLVVLLVVGPMLAASWLLAIVTWSCVRHAAPGGPTLWAACAAGGLAYGAIWAIGLGASLVVARWTSSSAAETGPAVSRSRAVKAGVWLGLLAVPAGVLATYTALLFASLLNAGATAAASDPWRAGLTMFPLVVVSLLLAVTLHVGLVGTLFSEQTREWWGRIGGLIMLLTALWTGLELVALYGPHAFEWVGGWAGEHKDLVKTGLAAAWAAITGAGVYAGHSNRTGPAGESRWLDRLGRLAPAVFVLGYLVILANVVHRVVPIPGAGHLHDLEAWLRAAAAGAAVWPAPEQVHWIGEAFRHVTVLPAAFGATLGHPAGRGLLLAAGIAGALAYGLSRRVGANDFSLHALYRNRLVRCYLGASNPRRNAHPFTGFDPSDDLELARLDAADPSDRRTGPGQIRPYPIFSAALNLVGGGNLAWQQRKAASFVFTPDYCGYEYRIDEQRDPGAPHDDGDAPRVSVRAAFARTAEHASVGALAGNEPLTVGLAVATSGAAASPNMGYHTSPLLSFLMAVFNVRLGWWLRNPGLVEKWTDSTLGLSLFQLLSEMFGLTTDRNAWVYLSDGGHFENLGLYELVRRRCRYIIACDAGQDGALTFEDLGNAIEKCRADFGVDIEMEVKRIRLDAATRYSAWHCAVGTIRYDHADAAETPGTLLYIKSSLTGNEPADVLRYAALHAEFPHESTGDQFFDESQFESYRALGYHVACTVLQAVADPAEFQEMEVSELFTRLRQHWTPAAPAPAGSISRSSRVLNEIWHTVRADRDLTFLDAQMFPEWPSLLRGSAQTAPTTGQAIEPPADAAARGVNYWLPPSADERRKGFYVCTQILQLMEDVYLELRLEDYHDHIDHRGWMNLFQHWAWSGMLCATWAITGATYDPRFQRFCRRRLDLMPGRVSVSLDAADPLPAWASLAGPEREAVSARWQAALGLNFWEAELLARYLDAAPAAADRALVPIQVTVESPRRIDGNPMRFNVGFAVLGAAPGGEGHLLHYIRIQNHLRKMGLAEQALTELVERGLTDVAVGPERDQAVTGRATDEAYPTRASARQLKQLVAMLRQERGTGPVSGAAALSV